MTYYDLGELFPLLPLLTGVTAVQQHHEPVPGEAAHDRGEGGADPRSKREAAHG
jgi:hypothetical protein